MTFNETFTKHPNNPLMHADDVGAEAWEDWQLFAPKVLDGGGDNRVMWYSGGTGTTVEHNDYQIGRATSDDAGESWARDTANNPVFLKGAGGAWDAVSVLEFFPVWDPVAEHLKAYYSGVNAAGNVQIGLATSNDGMTGISWTRFGSSPVIANGGAGSEDEAQAAKPSVIRMAADDWRMWYSSLKSPGASNNFTISYATSADGESWSTVGKVYERTGYYCVYPFVLFEAGVFKLYVQEGINGERYELNRYVSTTGTSGWVFTGEPIHRSSDGNWDDHYIGGGHSIIDTSYGRELYYSARDKATQEPLTRRYHAIGRALIEQPYTGGSVAGAF